MKTMAKNNHLLRCPFCGGEATIEPWHGGGPKKRRVGCASDDCHVSPAVCGSTPKLAIKRWNTRAITVEP